MNATHKTGRPAIHASNAARQKAYRQRWATVTATVPPSTADFIDALARQFDMPRTQVAQQLILFAAANRNWKQQGVTGWTVKPRVTA